MYNIMHMDISYEHIIHKCTPIGSIGVHMHWKNLTMGGEITNFNQIAKDTKTSRSHALASKSKHENVHV